MGFSFQKCQVVFQWSFCEVEHFYLGAEVTQKNKTLEDGTSQERLPKPRRYSARHFEDLPTVQHIAQNLLLRGHRRVGSSAIASEQLPML